MTTEPRSVDVIIPTYNQADFLREALKSVVAQDYQYWNAIVINNMSTDHTRDVVEEFHDSRVTMIDFANGGVIAASRNIGIAHSNATYVAFLDSDDWWHSSKLRRCVERLESGVDLVCHAEEWRSSSTSRFVTYGPEHRTRYRELLLRGNCLSTSAVVGRTSMFQQLGGFSTNPEFITAEDYEFWLRLAERQFKFAFLAEPLGVFRIHASSASASVERNARAEMAVVKHHLTRANITSRRIVRRRQAMSHYAAGRAHHRGRDFRNAWLHFGKAMRTWPLFARTYAGAIVLLAATAARWFARGFQS